MDTKTFPLNQTWMAPEEKPNGVSQTVSRDNAPMTNRNKRKLSSRQRRKLKQRELAANAVPAPATLQHTEKNPHSPGECNSLLAQETVCQGRAVGSQSPGGTHLKSAKQAQIAVKRTHADNNTAPRSENKRPWVDKPNAVPAPSPLHHTEKTPRSHGECNKPLAQETVCQGMPVGSHPPGGAHSDSTKQAQTAAKITQPVNKTAPRGENKRPCVDKPAKINPPRSYDDPSNVVAITLAEADFLDKTQSHQIIKILQDVILRLAREQPAEASGPQFRGKPFYNGWSLQLWCMDAHTRCWLKNTIEDIRLPSGERLTTKRLSEMQRMVRSGILIPGIHETGSIPLMLAYQNPWAGVDRWMFHVTTRQGKNTFLLVGIPEDVVKVLIKCERRLGFMLGSVYVKFQGTNKKFSDVPPKLSMDDEDENYRTSTTNNYTDAKQNTSELQAYAMPNTSAEPEASTIVPHHYLKEVPTKSHDYLNVTSPTYLNEVSSTSHHSLKEASTMSHPCLNEASSTSNHSLKEASTISQIYLNEASTTSHHYLNEASTKSHHYLNESSPTSHHHLNEASPTSEHYINEASPTSYHHLNEASPTSDHYVNEASTKYHQYLNEASPTSHHYGNESYTKSHHYLNEASPTSRHYVKEESTKSHHYLNEAPPTSQHYGNDASTKSHHYINETSTPSATPFDGMPDSADEYTYENLESPDECDWDSWYEED